MSFHPCGQHGFGCPDRTLRNQVQQPEAPCSQTNAPAPRERPDPATAAQGQGWKIRGLTTRDAGCTGSHRNWRRKCLPRPRLVKDCRYSSTLQVRKNNQSRVHPETGARGSDSNDKCYPLDFRRGKPIADAPNRSGRSRPNRIGTFEAIAHNIVKSESGAAQFGENRRSASAPHFWTSGL